MSLVKLRLTSRHHEELREHLFPGDGKEAVALALCGRGAGLGDELVLIHELHLVPHGHCRREDTRVDWSPSVLESLLARAEKYGLAILKVHSHPTGFAQFSKTDDESDRNVFESVFGWLDSDRPHVSAVMLPDGRIFGRAVHSDGSFVPLVSVTVVGDEVTQFFERNAGDEVPRFAERHAQIFGPGTTALLRRLRVAVVGCSGTGSPVIEQLARLGASELILVDPDPIEERNLNRIVGATRDDIGRLKVDVLKEHVEKMGLGTTVHAFPTSVEELDALRAVASCDFVFGCMDALRGRYVLSRLGQYYVLPYVDTGVKLEALKNGTINQVAGTVHYLAPDGPDFFERQVLSAEQLRAEDLYRTDPQAYAEQRERGYVHGVRVDQPAVISVNITMAGIAVTEMLARLHPFRMQENAEVGGVRLSLSHLLIYPVGAARKEATPRRSVGRGDTEPPLGTATLGRRS